MAARYRCTATSLNMRKQPSLKGAVVGFLEEGEVGTLVSTSVDGYWFELRAGNRRGWCSHKFLAPVLASPEPEEFPWMPVALAEEGVKEFPGDADNPRIVEYLQSTTLPAPLSSQDETAWCSAFANWCVERSGYEGTDSAWARSWLKWGKRLVKPRRGCVAVLTRGTDSGHVGFWVGETKTTVRLLGGNQGDEVCISEYEKDRLLGYRVPGP